jgi:hypothetical protein
MSYILLVGLQLILTSYDISYNIGANIEVNTEYNREKWQIGFVTQQIFRL